MHGFFWVIHTYQLWCDTLLILPLIMIFAFSTNVPIYICCKCHPTPGLIQINTHALKITFRDGADRIKDLTSLQTPGPGAHSLQHPG